MSVGPPAADLYPCWGEGFVAGGQGWQSARCGPAILSVWGPACVVCRHPNPSHHKGRTPPLKASGNTGKVATITARQPTG